MPNQHTEALSGGSQEASFQDWEDSPAEVLLFLIWLAMPICLTSEGMGSANSAASTLCA